MYSATDSVRLSDDIEGILKNKKQVTEKVEEELLKTRDLLERVLQNLEQKENELGEKAKQDLL